MIKNTKKDIDIGYTAIYNVLKKEGDVVYKEKTANFVRLKTDMFFASYENDYEYDGFMDNAFNFINKAQLLRSELWERFVRQFKIEADKDDWCWRGEYWGKMMRGACLVYSYTKSDELYGILKSTVIDMIDSVKPSGSITTFGTHNEFEGWDMWCRKYVLLGMQYFLEICKDQDLYDDIVLSMRRQTDYIMDKIGEGKTDITDTSSNWRGLNSSSILEPIVRLYSITGDKRYFDFAEYIVNRGGTAVANIFELAYKNELMPYQYPITKAYEMISCFEGLLEFYRLTNIDMYRTAVINFADRILETDFTVIGCSGCTEELFDHSSVRQANTTNGKIQQETCVTVTLMKFFYQVALLTGDSKYVDAFETSLYNAYMGSLNTENQVNPYVLESFPNVKLEPLPFDSYSPLTVGTRGNGIGGLRPLDADSYYGCCACIGSAGMGLVPKLQLLTTKNGFALNLFINGTIKTKTQSGKKVVFNIDTDYPKSGVVNITLGIKESEKFELLIRNPAFSDNTTVLLNGRAEQVSGGYIKLSREWSNGDKITLNLDMRTKAIYPTPYGTQVLMTEIVWPLNYVVPRFDKEDCMAKHHIALRRGPLMLAQDSRLGYNPEKPISVKVNSDGFVDAELCEGGRYPNIISLKLPLENGETLTVIDYASSGKIWGDENKIAVWMLTE